jgi:DNA repair exonuclease SbcCD ATPase subunit
MRIAHVSDIHIRNLKFHADYRRVFVDFYRKLEELKVDLVVNTGDTAHTKTNISPEFVSMTSDFFTEVARQAPIINILGNHDLNLMNEDRQDAITPIVEALGNMDIVLWKKSGPARAPRAGENSRISPDFIFYNFSIADVGNWPRGPYSQKAMNGHPQINIGLFHGSIKNCLTDSNFRMTQVEYDTDIFEGLDFVMMGDIHKRQSFNGGRVWYAGSMIQQNFGEDPDKGFLLWDIRSKDDYLVEFHELRGNRKFYTVPVELDIEGNVRLPQIELVKDSRIRLLPPRSLTLVEQKAIEKLAKKRFEPHDIITLSAQNIGQKTTEVTQVVERIENLRRFDVQERLLRDFFRERKIDEKVMNRMLDLNRKYQVAIEQRDDVTRGINWKVLKVGWNNLYNYGEGNVIDFSQVKGVSGIFAPNASGKSGLVDVLPIGLFDCNTKEVMKNIHLINDNKDNAVAILELMANGERYTITRELERIKYGQRKGKEKEWGKTTLNFVRNDRDGGVESLVGELRPDTEKQIRRRFGTFDDFMLTSLFAQWDPMDIIQVKETERKRILFRFLDLEIFEEKEKLAKDEMKQWIERLVELEEGNYEGAAENLRETIVEVKKLIEEDEVFIEDLVKRGERVQSEIEQLLEEKSNVPQLQWKLSVEQDSLHRSEQNIEIISEQMSSLNELVKKHSRLLPYDTQIDIELCKKASRSYSELQYELNDLENSMKLLKLQLENLQKKTEILSKVPCGDQFPSCQFLVEALSAKKPIDEIRQKMTILEIDRQTLHQQITLAEKLKNEYERYNAWEKNRDVECQRLSKLKLQSEKLQAEMDREVALKWTAEERINAIEKAAADVLRNQELDRQIGNTRLNKREIERVLIERREALAHHHKELGSNEGILERLEASLNTLAETREICSAFEHFTEAMGKDGIALQILTQKLPLINEEINKILAQSAEFGVEITYDPEEQSIRLFLQYGSYKSRLLELGSGAEKFLASVAIRSALLSISNLPRSNLFIIDEGFGKLDPQNLEAVARMFDYLRSIFDHVIVISHLDTMKDLVDNIIEITPDDEGYAHVEIGS